MHYWYIINAMLYNKCISHLKRVYSQMSKNMKTNKVDGLFVVPFGPLILKTVSPLDPRSLIARRNPAYCVQKAKFNCSQQSK